MDRCWYAAHFAQFLVLLRGAFAVQFGQFQKELLHLSGGLQEVEHLAPVAHLHPSMRHGAGQENQVARLQQLPFLAQLEHIFALQHEEHFVLKQVRMQHRPDFFHALVVKSGQLARRVLGRNLEVVGVHAIERGRLVETAVARPNDEGFGCHYHRPFAWKLSRQKPGTPARK